MTLDLYRPTHPSHDAPCLVCWIESRSAPDHVTGLILAEFRLRAEAFAVECGGSPAQLDHYAWQHLTSTPGYWSDNGTWERD